MAVTSCAKCSYCGKEIALKKDGTFRFHLMPKNKRYWPPECIGTGEKPATAHSCDNCNGIDPDSCLFNENRAR